MSGGVTGVVGATVGDTDVGAHDAAAIARQNDSSRHACIGGDDSILITLVPCINWKSSAHNTREPRVRGRNSAAAGHDLGTAHH